MTLEQIEALITVHRSGSLAEAARRLGVPRTSLMRRVDELEASLGVPLIHRTSDGVTLTTSGERLVVRGQALLDAAAEVGASVAEDWELQGALRLAYPTGLHPTVLVSAARMMMQALPGLQVHAHPWNRALDPGEVDVAFHIGLQPPAGAWVARALTRVPLRLLAGAAYGDLPTTVEELEAHPVFSWTAGAEGPPALALTGGGFLPIRPRLQTADLHFLHQAARAGLALVWAVEGGLEESPGVERLCPVLPDRIGTTVPIWLLLPEATRNAPRVREAVAWLVQLTSLSATAAR